MPAASSISAQTILLPDIPELFEDAFLDILLPASVGSTADAPAVTSPAGNPMVDALIASSFQTFTENGALAYNSTDSPILDAFNNLSDHTVGSDIASYLSDAWEQDPGLTLRLIWNLRSIPDGKGYKEIFYRCVYKPLGQSCLRSYITTERLVGYMTITPGLQFPIFISWLNPFVSPIRRASHPRLTALGKISSIYFALPLSTISPSAVL